MTLEDLLADFFQNQQTETTNLGAGIINKEKIFQDCDFSVF